MRVQPQQTFHQDVALGARVPRWFLFADTAFRSAEGSSLDDAGSSWARLFLCWQLNSGKTA